MSNFEIYDEGGAQMMEEKYQKRMEEFKTLKADFEKRKEILEKMDEIILELSGRNIQDNKKEKLELEYDQLQAEYKAK